MISFMSSWAEQIVLAVIVATIIEMILPKNKNRKYIQMVIGIYVLFNIISPIIENKEEFSIEKYNIEKYETKSQYEIDQSSMDERLEKIYLKELEDTVKLKFEENNVVKIRNTDNMQVIDDIKKELADELEVNKNIITVK